MLGSEDDFWSQYGIDLGSSGSRGIEAGVPASVSPSAASESEADDNISKRSKVVERPAAPDDGRSSLFTDGDWSRMPRGPTTTVKNGISRGDITAVDVMMVAAGSEATRITEEPGTDDGAPLGIVGRAVERMNNIQQAVKARGGPDIGVADVNIVSSDDFRCLELDPKDRALNASMKAAVDGEQALKMSPYYANENGENIGFDFGHGKVLTVIPTGDIGGGKDLAAYNKRNFKQTAKKISHGLEVPDVQRKVNPASAGIVLPPLVSTGGTSMDGHMAMIGSASIASTPPGTPQFVTVAPQGALPTDKAVNATRKKMASIVALTGIAGGWRDSPVIILDGADDVTRASIDADRTRTVLEHFCGLQPETLDRSDLINALELVSSGMGRGCDHARIEDRRGNGDAFTQSRELFLSSAFSPTMNEIVALSKGEADLGYVGKMMGETLGKAMSQATGRTGQGVDNSRAHIQRKSMKMVYIVVFIPDDVEISKPRIVALENAYANAVNNWFVDDKQIDTIVATYRLPAVALPAPIVSVRMMTHTNDVLEMLKIDAPELFEKRLTHQSHTTDKPLHRLQQNHNWRSGIAALHKTGHKAMERWAQLLGIVSTHMYGHRGKKVQDGFVQGRDESQSKTRPNTS